MSYAQKILGNFKAIKFTNSQKLRLLFIAIILGVFFGQFIFVPSYLLIFGFLLLISSFWFKNLLIGIFAGFLLANSYAQWNNFNNFKNDYLPNIIGQEVNIIGNVISFPDVREKNIRVIVDAKEIINKGENNKKISGKFLLIIKNPAKLDYGNKISVHGKIVYPSNFSPDFDYRKYLKRFGVQTIIKNPQSISRLDKNVGNWFLHKAKISRNFLEHNLEKSLPKPHSNIAMGVLIGVKNELPKWTQNDFKKSGLQHLLVVSGTNVVIVIIAIGFLLKKFGRKISFICSIIALIFFVLMTGAEAPVIRAAIMGTLVGLSVSLGKMSDARNIVLLSAVIIGVLNPMVLQSDIGFLLSFGATIGIIIGVPIFDKLFRKITKFRGILTILSVSLAAQITILPIIIRNFGRFPIGGIPANLFSEPLMPLIMLFSAISSIGGVLPEIIAKIIAIPAYILLEFLLQIANFFGQIEPIIISDFYNFIFAVLIIIIIIYGLFSRDFEEKFLVLDD